MRILIVGYGRMGQRRARACVALGHDVHAVEPREEWAQYAGWGLLWGNCVSFYASLGEAPACDAAFICTPAETHEEVAVRVGYPRMAIEKPLDVASGRGRALASVLGDSRVCVAYTWRFHPVVRDFRAAIATSGDLRVLRFTCFAPKRLWSAPPKPGQLWPECSHDVDLALWMVGKGLCEVPLRRDEMVVAEMWHAGSQQVTSHHYVSIEDTLPGNRRIFEALTSTERIVMATDAIDESVYDAETAAILAWWDGVEDDRICTLALAQRVLEAVA